MELGHSQRSSPTENHPPVFPKINQEDGSMISTSYSNAMDNARETYVNMYITTVDFLGMKN